MNRYTDSCYSPHAIETFEWNAERHPYRTAVRYRDRAISYRELDEKAHVLALHLRHLGVTESAVIGVLLRPGVDSVVALLGIMKLRAVYVPLDIEYPEQQLRAIVADVQPVAIVSKPAEADRLDFVAVPLLDIDTICRQRVTPVHRDFFSLNDPLAPAYIFYTSGSTDHITGHPTNHPTGIVGTQQDLMHYLRSAISVFGMGSHTVMPALAPSTSSISLLECLCPLLAGGCVVMLDREHVRNLSQLAAVLETVTMFHMGSSLLEDLVVYLRGHYASAATFAQVRQVALGGDRVAPASMQKLAAIFAHAEIFPLDRHMQLDRAALSAADNSHRAIDDFSARLPRTPLESELIELWQRLLGIEHIGVNHNFFDLGGDSILATGLIVELEKRYGREISITTFLEAPTIAAIARRLADATVARLPPESFQFRSGTGGTLFLLHGAIVYRELAAAIDSPGGICAVFADEDAKLLGAQNTSQRYEMPIDVTALAEHYLREIKRVQPHGPYVLAGFSIGGLVTMEVAKCLRRGGDHVANIFLIDCAMPDFFSRFYWGKLLVDASRTLRGSVAYFRYALQCLATPEKNGSVEPGAKTDWQFQKTGAARYLPTYKPSKPYFAEYYDGDVVLFRPSIRQHIAYVPKDRTLGWKKYLPNLTVYDVPAEQLDILKGASARRIAGLISSYLSLPVVLALQTSSFDTASMAFN